jgi:hypothetical protein
VRGGVLFKLMALRAPVDKTEIALGLWRSSCDAIRFTKDVARVAPERPFPRRLPLAHPSASDLAGLSQPPMNDIVEELWEGRQEDLAAA